MVSLQEDVVAKFSTLMGTKRLKETSTSIVASSLTAQDPVTVTSREMMKCFSRSVASHEVICSLPSLDIRDIDDEGNGSSPLLPKVGEHFEMELTVSTPEGDSAASSDSPEGTDIERTTANSRGKPDMAASVLNSAVDASAKASQVEQKAAQSLGELTSWTKSSVQYAPGAISKNASDSFSSLVDSRVRAWTLLLLRHSLSTGDSASRSRLLSMLSSIVKVGTARTAFKTLPLPQSAAGHPKEADVILPLLLEVDIEVSIQNKDDTVTLRAPGTVAGM